MTPAEWLTERLGGKWASGFGMAQCPAHDDRSPSLSIRDGDDSVLLKDFTGCTSIAIIEKLRGCGLWPVPAELSGQRREYLTRDTAALALKTWREARAIADTAAEKYLRQRGIDLPLPPTLRYCSALKHAETGLYLPALVAAIQAPDRTVCAVQRTYLKFDGNGKAPVTSPKMTLGPMGAAAVRLAKAEIETGIAEGIETGLSAMQLFGIPVWCSLGAERLGKIALPPDVARVVIFGDVGSEAAAYRARDIYERQGRKATVRFPSVPKDFNDELFARARAAA